MTEETIKVALAALLHDIGKFHQRAFWGRKREPHDQQGARWVESCLAPKLEFLSDENKREVADAVREHHGRPYDRGTRAVVIADRLASGERLARQDEEPGDPSREPLMSVFSSVRIAERPRPAGGWAYCTQPLALDRNTIFPVPTEQCQVDYYNLWTRFEEEIGSLQPRTLRDGQTTLTILLALLRKYAWCVPAAVYKSEPDVSLADHLKVTAAIAVCVAELGNDKIDRFEEASEHYRFSDEPTCLLVGGDVTGIQRFLYAVSSEGAAKGLRGRSTYLSLLSEATARLMLRELRLPPTNLLYSSGGHFYVLAPLSVQNRLPQLVHQLTESLLAIHGGELGVVLDAVVLMGQDFSIRTSRLPLRWRELSRRLSEQKHQRFRDVAQPHFTAVFGPFGGGGIQKRCVVCHEEQASFAGFQRLVGEEEGVDKCSLCQSFEILGDDIAKRNAFLVALRRTTPPERELKWHTALAALGMELWLCDREVLKDKASTNAIVARLNDTDLAVQEDIPVHDFRWLPTFTPMQNGGILDLEKIADNSDGASYWSALRMDLDNLGQVFQQGLGSSYSLSRVSTLSSMLSLFFEGYLNNVCAGIDPQRKHLYLLYAGGDDLLLVGSWDRVVEAARRVHDEFAAFTCCNPSLTVSAGISLHYPKFPLYQAADDSGVNLYAAKHFKHPDGHEKDGFGFFGKTMCWKDFDWLRGWKETLVQLIERGRTDGAKEVKLSRAFLFKLATISNLVLEQERAEKAVQYSLPELAGLVNRHKAMWRLVYHIAREHKAFRGELGQLRNDLWNDNARHLAHLNALVRWVELATRKERG